MGVFMVSNIMVKSIRYGVMVNIPRFHRGARGSIPRTGVVFAISNT